MKCVKCKVCKNHRSRQRRFCNICLDYRALPTCRPEHCWVRCLEACRDCVEKEFFPSYLPSVVSLSIIEFLDDGWRIALVRVQRRALGRCRSTPGHIGHELRPAKFRWTVCILQEKWKKTCGSKHAHATPESIAQIDRWYVRTYVHGHLRISLFISTYVPVYEFVYVYVPTPRHVIIIIITIC